MPACSALGYSFSVSVTKKEGVSVFIFLLLRVSHYAALAGLVSCSCLPPPAGIKGVCHHSELEKRNREITQPDLYSMAKKTCASFCKLDSHNGGRAGRADPAGGSRVHSLTIGSTAPAAPLPRPRLGSSEKDPPSPEHPHDHSKAGSNWPLEFRKLTAGKGKVGGLLRAGQHLHKGAGRATGHSV